MSLIYTNAFWEMCSSGILSFIVIYGISGMLKVSSPLKAGFSNSSPNAPLHAGILSFTKFLECWKPVSLMTSGFSNSTNECRGVY